jgi:eukaryotic-like serine/threonine-protein kinase
MHDTAAKDRWARLSPLLGELLAREGANRAERIAELRLSEPALADDVESLLGTLSGIGGHRDLSSMPASPPLGASLAGQTIGAYTIERELGQGGMGSVWLAHRSDGRFDGQVAIKFLNAGLASRFGRERFDREGSILARLAHPHIARMLDAGVTADGQPYLVLEYVDGVPIKRYCEDRALDLAGRIRLFLDVLAAVAHAHSRLILHRDLKPSNILVTAAGDVKLLDFGIAKLLDDATVPTAVSELTQAAGRAFTLQYAAPEQVRDGEVSTATDVYSLGVLLYVLLGGVHPTAAATATAIDQMRAVIETEPRKVSEAVLRNPAAGSAAAKLRRARALRGDLDNIVAKALKKAPAERYANAGLLADDLQRFLAHEPVAARPDAVGYLLAKFVRRHRLGVAASGVVVASLAVGIGVALWEANEAQRQRVQAEGLIEFMLGDLRKKLQPVGRLDVLDAVGAKALDYYAAQNAGRLDADSLGRRARALHLIGEITERRGSLDDATRVFRRAADSTAELMARAPGNAQRVFDHAQSMYWVGYVAWRRGRVDEAEAAFRQYQALAQQLTRVDPANPDWRTESAYAGQNLGVLRLDAGRFDEAEKAFADTRDVWLGLVPTRPESRYDLANSWGWIAKAREAKGEFDAAIAAQQAKIEVLREAPDIDQNRRAQRLLANAGYELGRLQLVLGHYVEAAQVAERSLARIAALVALDESNTEWLAQMTFARLSLAECEIASGQQGKAIPELDRAARDMAKLLTTDVARSNWNVALVGGLLLQRLALTAAEPPPRRELEEVAAAVQGIVAGGRVLDLEQVRIASAVELALGDRFAREAQPAAARSHWLAAVELTRSRAGQGNLPAMTLLAHARLRLGAIDEADALAARIEASPYRHPAYADLRQRLAAAKRVRSATS